MEISTATIKELRQRTGAGVMDCKTALVESAGDIDGAIDFLRKKGLAKAAKKADRTAADGLVGSYIHAGGKIGVLVDVNCETDFVAKTEVFQNLVKELAMHIAAMSPIYVNREDVSTEVVEKEKEILRAEAAESGKPDNVVEKIVEGRLEKFFAENCLMEQTYMRDPETTIKDLIYDAISTLGENIIVRRFIRYQVGEAP